MEWEEVKAESNIWLPSTEGQQVVGKIVSQNQGQYGLQTVIEQDGGDTLTLPSHKVLQNRLLNCKIGDLIKVTYLGEELPKIRGQNPTKIYKVHRKSPLQIEEI